MGNPLIQPTFAGGELSPSLQARVDIERYGNSAKTLKNFIVRPYGGAVNRAGFQFLGETKDSSKRTRVIPFIFSTIISYVIELSDQTARFWANGSPIYAATSDAYSGVTVYGLGDLVLDFGIVYRSLQAANTGNTPASSPLWWEPNPVLELATPWDDDEIFDLKFTQSADVVFLTHVDHPPQRLSRVSATEFTLADFVAEEGPFREINANEAYKIAVSSTNGPVTVSANADIFTADMVGQLLYVETKALGQVKPWTQGDRAVAAGVTRRSDGKTYLCTQVATGGTDWVESGSFRPVHQNGREWDGPGDQRTNGTQTWAVGAEWEYKDSGYGIVRLEGFTDANTMTGTVVRALPSGVVGGLGAAANSWTFSGDGATTVFSITGALSLSEGDYEVKIDGVLVQSDPNYRPPSNGSNNNGGGPIFIEP